MKCSQSDVRDQTIQQPLDERTDGNQEHGFSASERSESISARHQHAENAAFQPGGYEWQQVHAPGQPTDKEISPNEIHDNNIFTSYNFVLRTKYTD